MHYVKLITTFHQDPRITCMSKNARLFYINALSFSGANDTRGTITLQDCRTFETDLRQVRSNLATLLQHKLLQECSKNVYKIVAWDTDQKTYKQREQGTSDTSPKSSKNEEKNGGKNSTPFKLESELELEVKKDISNDISKKENPEPENSRSDEQEKIKNLGVDKPSVDDVNLEVASSSDQNSSSIQSPPPTQPEPESSGSLFDEHGYLDLGDEIAQAQDPKIKPHHLPSEWRPSEKHKKYANEHGLDIGRIFISLQNKATNDVKYLNKNWDLAFWTFLHNAKRWADLDREKIKLQAKPVSDAKAAQQAMMPAEKASSIIEMGRRMQAEEDAQNALESQQALEIEPGGEAA